MTAISPTALRLALLWTSLMSLYIYNDYFSLYMPGEIEHMMAGRVGPLGPATPGVMIGVSLMLAVPALMISLSVLLPGAISRWLNVGFGLIYTAIQVLTLASPYGFFQIVVVLEIAVTCLIMGLALRWKTKREA